MSAVAMKQATAGAGGAGGSGAGSKHDILEGEFLGLNHSPPQFTPSSYEMTHHKVRRCCGLVCGGTDGSGLEGAGALRGRECILGAPCRACGIRHENGICASLFSHHDHTHGSASGRGASRGGCARRRSWRRRA